MSVLKDLYREKKEWKEKVIDALENKNQKSYKTMKTLQHLYYDYYLRDKRYQHCNRIKYLSSVRLSVEEKWLFVLFKGFFNSFCRPFKVSNDLREDLYDYLEYGLVRINSNIYSYNPKNML